MPTTAGSYLLVWFLVAAGVAATIVTVVVLVAARQRRRPTLSTAPPSGPAPVWPTPGPYAPPPTWGPPVTGTRPPPEPATIHDPPATSSVEQAPPVPDPRGSSNGSPPARPAATASSSERPEPDLPSSYPQPPLPAPAIRVLGVVVLEGWANPPAATNLIELATYLAVRNTAVSSDTLRNRLSPHADTDLGKQTIRVYCSRLRGTLDPGVELVSTKTGYHLTGITTDLATFSDLATRDPGGDPDAAIERLGHALALITGPPLARADYRWAAADNLTATITTQTRLPPSASSNSPSAPTRPSPDGPATKRS
ncbi:MAG: hypothetical protein M3Y91_02880 [Actinomycetota bacterium]|nr:hypothetical protein [Actinomycetota bacterium]